MEVANPRFWPGDRSSVFLFLCFLIHSILISAGIFRLAPFYVTRNSPSTSGVWDLCFLLFQEKALFKTADCLLYKICGKAIFVSYDGFTGPSNSNRKHSLCFLFCLREQNVESWTTTLPFYVFGSSVFVGIFWINYSFQFLCRLVCWIPLPISFYVRRWNILNNDIRISVPLCPLAFETVSLLRLCISDSLILPTF
jgi:hypothetical protein